MVELIHDVKCRNIRDISLLCSQLRKIKRHQMIGSRQHSQESGEATIRIACEMNITPNNDITSHPAIEA